MSGIGEFIIALVLWIAGSAVALLAVAYLIRSLLQKRFVVPDRLHLTTLLVQVPKEVQADDSQEKKEPKDRIAPMENFYANLGGLKPESGWRSWLFGRHDHVALEIVAEHDHLISFYVTAPRMMQAFVMQQLHAQFPDAHIEEKDDYNIFSANSVELISELRLVKPNMYPIQTYDDSESDPLNAMTNAMSQFEAGESGAIQILARSAKRGWRSGGAKFAREMQQGKKPGSTISGNALSVFADFKKYGLHSDSGSETKNNEPYRLSPMDEEVVKSIEKKASKAGMDVNIRVIASAGSEERARALLDNILNSFAQFASYEYKNAFKATKAKQDPAMIEKFIHRIFDTRKSFVFNTTEMASVFHLPLPDTETPNIRWLGARKATPPPNMPKDGIVLGRAVYRGNETVVRIKRADRRRHFYIIGKSGSGKSVLMENMAIQDIRNGDGVCVVDPHGELIENIMGHIPKERAEDVVYFNPADFDHPMGLNMLEYDNEEEQDFVVQEMIQIFYKLFPPEMIGPMFEHNMRNVMLTLMADKESPGTIAEIPRMFTDPEFQKYKTQFVKDPIVRAFWEKEMAKTSDFHKSEMLGYLISKVGRFVENAMMRNIIGQTRSGFNLKEIMNQQKILLVNLSKGQVGEVNSSLLGLIIVSKLQMAAQARANLPEDQRKDFYLYLDEFQNFVTDSIATILSEARKYRLDLIMAHQYIGQLVQANNDTKIRDAVFGNVGTVVSFRIGVEDAEVIAKEFEPVFSAYDVINIERFTAYIKLLIDNTASKAFNMMTYAPVEGDRDFANALKELSRAKYSMPRMVIEKEIMERTQLGQSISESKTPPVEPSL